MKIAIISAYNESMRELNDLTQLSRTAYCKKQGYDHHTLISPKKEIIVPQWLKVKALEQHLFNYDWCFWMDTDSIITNPEIKIEDIIGDTEADLIFTNGWHTPNFGMFFLRNSAWSNLLLKEWWSTRGRVFLLPEQTALALELYMHPKDKWEIRPREQFNSHHDTWKDKDFILHLAGWPNRKRLRVFKEYCWWNHP
jgi:hypothetical protein